MRDRLAVSGPRAKGTSEGLMSKSDISPLAMTLSAKRLCQLSTKIPVSQLPIERDFLPLHRLLAFP